MPQSGTSILTSTKATLGIAEDDMSFDTDIISAINSAFMVLNQLGVGPSVAFSIKSNAETWADFMTTNLEMFGGLETYLTFKTRLAFDPPATSFSIDAIKTQIDELEHRFMTQAMVLAYVPPVVPEEPEL